MQAPPAAPEPLPSTPAARVSTLTPASIQLLTSVGAWDYVAARSAPFTSMQVWDTSGTGYLRWDAADIGCEVMGHVAENTVIQQSLMQQLKQPGSNARLMWLVR